LLADDNHDGVSDGPVANQTLFTDSTVLPEWQTIHGIKVVESESILYYSTETSIWSMPFAAGTRRIDTSVVTPTLVANIPAARWTHTIDFDTVTQTLMATNGRYEGDDCPADKSLGGGVFKVGGANPLNGTQVVTGCRNPMYMKCSPTWGCYAMELTGDGWGGIGGGEKMIKIPETGPMADFGFPCCVQRNETAPLEDTDSNNVIPVPPSRCVNITLPVLEVPVTWTPMGFDWDYRQLWPAPYQGILMIGFHGSFGAWVEAGLQYVPWDYINNVPVAGAKPTQFIPGGWGSGGVDANGEYTGGGTIGRRVSDVFFHPDGRMFVADDNNGTIWWIAPTTLAVNSLPTSATSSSAAAATPLGATTTKTRTTLALENESATASHTAMLSIVVAVVCLIVIM